MQYIFIDKVLYMPKHAIYSQLEDVRSCIVPFSRQLNDPRVVM